MEEAHFREDEEDFYWKRTWQEGLSSDQLCEKAKESFKRLKEERHFIPRFIQLTGEARVKHNCILKSFTVADPEDKGTNTPHLFFLERSKKRLDTLKEGCKAESYLESLELDMRSVLNRLNETTNLHLKGFLQREAMMRILKNNPLLKDLVRIKDSLSIGDLKRMMEG